MFNVVIRRRLHVPREAVWHVLQDFGGRYRLSPLIEVEPVNDLAAGVGAERRLILYDDTWMQHRIVDLEEPRMLLMAVTRSSWPLKRAWVRLTLEDSDSDEPGFDLACQVSFFPPYGPFAPVVGLYYKSVFQSAYNVLLRGVEHFVMAEQEGGGASPLTDEPA